MDIDRNRSRNSAGLLLILFVAFHPCLKLPAQDTNSAIPSVLLKKLEIEGEKAFAMRNIGNLYYDGSHGVPKDLGNAFLWYKKAAEAGDRESMYIVGNCFEEGEGTLVNISEALKWYKKSAEAGYVRAMAALGDCYYFGFPGLSKNPPLAYSWYHRAEEASCIEDAFRQLLDISLDGNAKNINHIDLQPLRLSASNGNSESMLRLGWSSYYGVPSTENRNEAYQWFRKAALAGDSFGMFLVGACFEKGEGTPQNNEEALNWYKLSAKAGNSFALRKLGSCYYLERLGLPQSFTDAFSLFHKSAISGDVLAMKLVGMCYQNGDGIPQNYVFAYAWYSLSSGMGNDKARNWQARINKQLTPEMVHDGQQLAARLKDSLDKGLPSAIKKDQIVSGTGFFITTNGYIITAAHVVSKSTSVKILVGTKTTSAVVVRKDEKNDIALLKAEGSFSALPIIPSSFTKLGTDVFTIGFPNVRLQGVSPKLTKGVISGLNGIQDDPSCFQISAAIQPGNSGGPLINADGCVLGVINSRLNDVVVANLTGTIPQNVNYAVKSAYVLPLIDSLAEGSILVKTVKGKTFDDIVKLAESSTCIILVSESK